MKKVFLTLITCTVFLLGACEDYKVITDPCDPEFIGPPENGQCN